MGGQAALAAASCGSHLGASARARACPRTAARHRFPAQAVAAVQCPGGRRGGAGVCAGQQELKGPDGKIGARSALQETEGEDGNLMHIGNLPYSRKSAEKLMMQEILRWLASFRSEEHTSELQSRVDLVC